MSGTGTGSETGIRPHRTAHRDQDTGPGWTATRTGTGQWYSASEQTTGPDSTEQIAGTGYRTGYNAVHRNRCTDQDADSRQMTEQMNRTRYRWQDHSLIHLAQPQQQVQIHATASTRAQQPDQTKPQTSEQNTVPDSTQYTDTDTGTWKPGP